MNPLVIIRPEFFTFTETNNLLSGPALMATLKSDILQHLPPEIGDVTKHGACQVCVSGYSCALPWNAQQATQPSGPEEVRYTFGRKQCEKWMEMTSGSFFWTWLPYTESQGMGPKGWGFKEMVDCENLVPPDEFIARSRDIMENVQGAKARMVAMRKRACKKHERWCERKGAYEWDHWRFEVCHSAYSPFSQSSMFISPLYPFLFSHLRNPFPFSGFPSLLLYSTHGTVNRQATHKASTTRAHFTPAAPF